MKSVKSTYKQKKTEAIGEIQQTHLAYFFFT